MNKSRMRNYIAIVDENMYELAKQMYHALEKVKKVFIYENYTIS